MVDWQTVAVAFIVLAAALYAGRRGLSRLRSFRVNRAGGASDCATGCGSCEGARQTERQPANVLVQIKPSRQTPRRAAR